MANVYTRILDRLLPAAFAKALPRMGSKQLAASLNTSKDQETDTGASGKMNVPHYWAPFYHSRDRRGVTKPSTAAKLIWFRNKSQDPRLVSGLSPVNKSEVRHLTKEGLRYGRELNREAIRNYCRATGKSKNKLTPADYAAANLPMIVADQSPRDGNLQKVKENPFFSDEPGGGMDGFVQEAEKIMHEVLFEEMESFLRETGLKKTEAVCRIQLPRTKA